MDDTCSQPPVNTFVNNKQKKQIVFENLARKKNVRVRQTDF